MDALKEITALALLNLKEQVEKLEKRVEEMEKKEGFFERQRWAKKWNNQGGK